MQGKILKIDETQQTGVISGSDGKRYRFSLTELNNGVKARSGMPVDFEARDEETAADIYADQSHSSGISPRLIAGVLAIMFGYLGVHKFYLGRNIAGVVTLLIFFGGFFLLAFPSFIIVLASIMEGVLFLSRSDEKFEQLYIHGNKSWF